jgi:hypothetical protein
MFLGRSFGVRFHRQFINPMALAGAVEDQRPGCGHETGFAKK